MKLKEGLPRHQQISDWLRERIEDGVYEADEKLLSENQMAKKFDVSRVTVRKALQTLENEGLIYRSQGLGSFVSDRRSKQSLIHLTDFVEDMRKAGIQATSSVIEYTPLPIPNHIAAKLGGDSGATGLRLDRLRLGDDQPIAFDITWLPMFYGQLLEDIDLEHDTIYNALETTYDIPIEKGSYRIDADNASRYIGEHLGVKKGTALLRINRLSYTTGDKPVYYQKRYYRTDRIVYEMMVERQQGGSSPNTNVMPLREFVPVFWIPEN